jgi:hypothetical protein
MIMRKKLFRICFAVTVFSFSYSSVSAQQLAPVTVAESISGCEGDPCAAIPVSVAGFSYITALSLRMEYDTNHMTFCGYDNFNPLMNGFAHGPATQVSGSLYKLMVTWASTNPVSLADGSKLFDVQFTLKSGIDSLSFNNSSSGGSDCEYADTAGNALPDLPSNAFYHNAVITVYLSPVPTINGPPTACVNSTGNMYVTESGMTGYNWSVTGGTITTGAGTSVITVTWNDAGTQSVSVTYDTPQGCAALNPAVYPVIVNPIPEAPTITWDDEDFLMISNAPEGNQWYFQGVPIPGATQQTYSPEHFYGYYWDVVTLNGCSSDTSNNLYLVTGIPAGLLIDKLTIYPDPNDGMFTVKITTKTRKIFSFIIYNSLGVKIFEQDDIEVSGTLEKLVNLKPVSNGVYSFVLLNKDRQRIKKIIVGR